MIKITWIFLMDRKANKNFHELIRTGRCQAVMGYPGSSAFGETDCLFSILFDMLWKWQANFTVHQHSLLPCSLLLSPCMKWNSCLMNLSDSDFPALLWSLDLLYTRLAICSMYLLHEGPLIFFSRISVSSLPDPVTLETLCPSTESNTLGTDYQDGKLCHFGNLPGSEHKLGGLKVSLNNMVVFEMKIHFHRK